MANEQTYTLEDGEALNREHPDRFEIPARHERETLAPGDHAKVVFVHDGQGERMWVEVSSADPADDSYEGALANRPTLVPIKLGDVVRFEPRHVIQIVRAEASG